MKLQDYRRACKAIHEELAGIADEMRNMALTKCADSSNPRYVGLMNRQDQLFKHLKELDNQPLED